ncbi:MAG: membrane protein insertase YidC [Planctomycetota bacterium]
MSPAPTRGPSDPPQGRTQNPNRAARLIVPLVALLLGIAFAGSFLLPDKPGIPEDDTATTAQVPAPQTPGGEDAAAPETSTNEPTAPPETGATAQASTPTTGPAVAQAEAGTTEPAAAQPEPDATTGDSTPTAAPRYAIDPDASADRVTLGSTDPASEYVLELELNPRGAGVSKIALAQYPKRVGSTDPLVLFDGLDIDGPDLEGQPGSHPLRLAMFTARRLTLDGQDVTWPGQGDASGSTYAGVQPWTLADRGPGHATFTVEVVDQSTGAPLLRVLRTYRLEPGSYDVALDQRLVNLTNQPVQARWLQYANADLNPEAAAYLGDRRQVVLGYFDPVNDPNRVRVNTDGTFLSRRDLAKDFAPPRGQRDADAVLWPSPEVDEEIRSQAELVWLATESRYFAVIIHPIVPEAAQRPGDIPPLTAQFPSVQADAFPTSQNRPELKPEDRGTIASLGSGDLTIAPGQTAPLDLAIYMGPRKDEVFDQAPYTLLGFEQTIRYQIPGPCAFCTFQWLAHLLLGYLKLLHAGVGDWGVAIILLVATVRLILHPITKKAQINMMKMGKQMQALQPELEKIKTKYADKPQELNKQMMALYREKGVNPAGALGCLPMFLQTPIWIALYAMLYYAIELRQESAFYGLFQAFGDWPFLADLSVADRFIPLYDESVIFKMPLLPLVFDYSSINILPLLMGVTFFINMKFTSPPPSNDQQAQQQKIMKFITLLFPFFLYSAPSGLTLYIMTSTLAGIVDSYIVRKHIKQQEEAGTLLQKKPRKEGGLMSKLQKIAEQKRAQLEAMQEAAAAGQTGGSGKGAKKPVSTQPGGRATQRAMKKRKKR